MLQILAGNKKNPYKNPRRNGLLSKTTYNLLYHPASLSFIPFFSISVIFIGLSVARMSHNNYGESPYTHLTTAIQICPVHNDISHIITDFLTCGLALTAHTCWKQYMNKTDAFRCITHCTHLISFINREGQRLTKTYKFPWMGQSSQHLNLYNTN